jgi:hypothetical protein
MTKVPILLITFKRLDTAKLVLNRIREYAPEKLFIFSDAARIEVPGETEAVKLCREELLSQIDWNCELYTNFSDVNLGCGMGPVAAINWFFKHVNEGIILEDDILPDQTFFNFCSELLFKYSDDENVMHIGGHTLGVYHPASSENPSYYFSKYNHCWGWATWARAWKKFQYKLNESYAWETVIEKKFDTSIERNYWKRIYQDLKNINDIWDYQWTLTMWYLNACAILPVVNLTKNIGFQKNATHTFNSLASVENGFYGKIEKIKSPDNLNVDKDKDLQMSNFFYELHCCVSPITLSDSVELEKRIELNVDEKSLTKFRNLYEVRLYRCVESGYRFYFPENLELEETSHNWSILANTLLPSNVRLDGKLLNEFFDPLPHLGQLSEKMITGEEIAIPVSLQPRFIDFSSSETMLKRFYKHRGLMDLDCFGWLADKAGFRIKKIIELKDINSDSWILAFLSSRFESWVASRTWLKFVFARLSHSNIMIRLINKLYPAQSEYSVAVLTKK